ncbi:MAG TPA: NADP-dependent malic enzyme [Acidimicrobiia bacterium]|jgi:malate dehydrogenase (oxaloacetate-decarboxylating)(NADP+)
MAERHFSEALHYHEEPRPGKLEVRATKPTATQHDLSLAYTPGVAEPCREIAADPDAAYRFTNRANLVAVVSNGTAVLGLGNIGALAGKPVMEGKAVLFKRFADIDVFDLEVGSEDPDDLIRFCELLEPTVGGINLEDIRAPDCFYVEEELRKRLDIPVFHDDQHGTAIIAGAAFLNALELTEKPIDQVKVVFSGAGAAGIATARFFQSLGVRPDHLLLCDSTGVIHDERDDLTPIKLEFARHTSCRTLADALVGADAFVGVSVAGTVSSEMVRAMADTPIVFALANPDPEITYEDARSARLDAIVATGRSDYPNQVNNVLGFPFIFRGALDVRAKGVSEGMKVAAARGLADLARQPVPDSVLKAYGADRIGFGTEYLIPKPFDPRVLWTVAPAVAMAATEEGLARRPLVDAGAYGEGLRARFQATYGLVTAITTKAKNRPMRVVFPHGDDLRLLRAARRVADEGIATPVLLGDAGVMRDLAAEAGLSMEGFELIDPTLEETTRSRYAATLEQLRREKGMTVQEAERRVLDPNMFGALMVKEGAADAVMGGLTTFYPETIRPALQVLPLQPGRTVVSAVYVMIIGANPIFFTDCAVNIQPTSEQLVEIAAAAVEVAARMFDREARVAFLSYSDFGSAGGEEPERVRTAVEIFRRLYPEVPMDGEMQADTAVVADLLVARHPGGPLDQAADILVFPNLTAANASYKLLNRLGGAEVIGPILTGFGRSVHVLQRDAEVGDVVNMTAIAVADAQAKSLE